MGMNVKVEISLGGWKTTADLIANFVGSGNVRCVGYNDEIEYFSTVDMRQSFSSFAPVEHANQSDIRFWCGICRELRRTYFFDICIFFTIISHIEIFV